jgi:hypothetical protein
MSFLLIIFLAGKNSKQAHMRQAEAGTSTGSPRWQMEANETSEETKDLNWPSH